MSYFADIIKNEIRYQLQYANEINRANQILSTVPAKQEESQEKIAKAVKAAFALEEEDELSQALYDTFPDIDPQDYGLPEPQVKRVAHVEEPQSEEPGTELEVYEPQPTPIPSVDETLEEVHVKPQE